MTESRWQRHLEQDVLGWWQANGADDELGGVLTCFDNRGRLLETTKYTWSQGRWAWLCSESALESEAGRLALASGPWAARARQTGRFLVDHVLTADGRTAYKVDRQGNQLAADAVGAVSISVFADLFVVLGLAGASRVVDETTGREFVSVAERLLAVAEASIIDRTARSEPYPVPPGFSDLAGPMTLVHVASELLRAAPESALGRQVRDRAVTRLTGPGGFLEQQSWWEFQPANPADRDSLLATHRTPGHLLELCWMLLHAQREAAERVDDDVELSSRQLVELARLACQIGWDAELGGIWRYTDRDGGRPVGRFIGAEPTPYEALVDKTWDTKLWWVHSEAMYATALLAEISGDAEMASWRDKIESYTMQTFPDREHGEWLQIRDRSGDPLDQVVALPVKDPMHIARSLLLLNRLAQAQEEGSKWTSTR